MNYRIIYKALKISLSQWSLLLCILILTSAQAIAAPIPLNCAGRRNLCVDQDSPYVCSRATADSGPSLNWPSKKASFWIHSAGSKNLQGTQQFDIIRQGLESWTQVENAQFSISYLGNTQQTSVGYNFLQKEPNQNLVIFQKKWPHDNSIIGLTTATFNAQTGEIFDADIELNDEHYVFTTSNEGVATDLLNTVTHESGHFYGFDHTDKGGRLTSECAGNATMARTTHLGETIKRCLAPSDILGMQFVYPAASNGIQYCYAFKVDEQSQVTVKQVSSSLGGCSESHGSAANSFFNILLTVLMVKLFRFRKIAAQTPSKQP